MIYECTDRRGKMTSHKVASELTADEAMTRLGVKGGSWTVVRYPEGRPDLMHTVQTYIAPSWSIRPEE